MLHVVLFIHQDRVTLVVVQAIVQSNVKAGTAKNIVFNVFSIFIVLVDIDVFFIFVVHAHVHVFFEEGVVLICHIFIFFAVHEACATAHEVRIKLGITRARYFEF